MAEKPDLRNQARKPGLTPAGTDAKLAGTQGARVLPDTGEHQVRPLPGDTGGVAEGQVT